MKDHIKARNITIPWRSHRDVQCTPIHVAAHFASSSNRDYIIKAFFDIFPELINEINTPKSTLHHIAIWTITNQSESKLRRTMRTLDVFRENRIKMIQMTDAVDGIITAIIDQGSSNLIGILSNVEHRTFAEPKAITVGSRVKQHKSCENEVDVIKFIISDPLPIAKYENQRRVSRPGKRQRNPRTHIAKNEAIDFEDSAIVEKIIQRMKEIPTQIKKELPFCNKTRSKQYACEAIDGLELAILAASETVKSPGTDLVYKEYYVTECIQRNLHSTMEENITAIHLAMIGVADCPLLLRIVRKLNSKYPELITKLTIWNETVLHYLLGKTSICEEPLEVLKFCRKCNVRINAASVSDQNSVSADHENHYKDSKWYKSDQKDEVLRYLKRWRDAEYPETDPTFKTDKTPASTSDTPGRDFNLRCSQTSWDPHGPMTPTASHTTLVVELM